MYRLVNNSIMTSEWLRLLRNKPEINKYLYNRGYIDKESHEKHMKFHSKDYFICADFKYMMGYISVINNNIAIAVSPEYQRQGVARFMLTEIIEKFKDEKLIADIHMDNKSSESLFISCGFKLEKETENNEYRTFSR